MNEIWRAIKGFENYEVSNLGNVRSKNRISIRNGKPTILKGKILKPSIGKRGYCRVVLYGGNRKTIRRVFVHTLVAEEFIPNAYNLLFVNHKDENPRNNRVDNLEWCTAKYNSNYGTAIIRRVQHQDWETIANKQSKPVLQMDKCGNLIKRFKSTMEADRNGFNCSGVSKCCNGHLKTYRGYLWKWENATN